MQVSSKKGHKGKARTLKELVKELIVAKTISAALKLFTEVLKSDEIKDLGAEVLEELGILLEDSINNIGG
jgi:hypothetical protein